MGLKDELSGFDRELFMFPVRAFEFKNAGTVVITQDMADVGSVVWDAEVVLAHYIDLAHGFGLRGTRFLELGAGTGLAGIVAAKLGATVLITDQAKLLPTIIANARANAPDLEASSTSLCERISQRNPHALGGCQARENGYPGAETAPRALSPLHASTVHSVAWVKEGSAELSESSSGVVVDVADEAGSMSDKCGVNDVHGMGIGKTSKTGQGRSSALDPCPSRRDRNLGHHGKGVYTVDVPTEDLERLEADAGGIGARATRGSIRKEGSWRVAELLFSEDESGLRAAVGLGAEEDGCSRLFDLVVAADVVYLVHLWDVMAFTIKTLVKPGGKALLSFEQRRGNVDSFFCPPRFGPLESPRIIADHVEWSRGEVMIGEESACTALGKAAAAANVRMFQVARRDGSLSPAADSDVEV